MGKKLQVNELIKSLKTDKWRAENGFSDDVSCVNEVLLDPQALRYEKEEALSNWLRSKQPCIFGRMASKENRIHFCFITPDDVNKKDAAIKKLINAEQNLWKHRALLGDQNPPHGFVLVVSHPDIVNAAPDEALKALSTRVREIWIPSVNEDEYGNDAGFEDMFLRNPNDGKYYKFSFTVDFFASAGDKRWWHDHRIPGGIAFTANGLGHMLKCSQWYPEKTPTVFKDINSEWALKNAMLTINAAQDTPQGKSTWLLQPTSAGPHQRSACPFAGGQPTHPLLKDKDWSSYAGYLHTDHSVRDEFFNPSEKPSNFGRPYFMDFTYIYDTTSRDYAKFVAGAVVEEDEMYKIIGTPEQRRILAPKKEPVRDQMTTTRIEKLLSKTREWLADVDDFGS
jgi:hypothetical protein